MKPNAILPAVFLLLGMAPAFGAKHVIMTSPQPQVLCDQYFCADQKEGVSLALTRQYLGDAKAQALSSQGAFDHASFTYANGVFCDVKTRRCHVDRYLDQNGAHSAVSQRYTDLLFGR